VPEGSARRPKSGAAGSGRQTSTLNSTVVSAGWVHLAFTYDAVTWHAYVNGVEDQSGAASGPLTTNASPVVMGRDDQAEVWYDGALANVALYPYALSAAQVASHFAMRTLAASGGGQLAYAIEANMTSATRAGWLTVAGVPVPVSQAAAGGLTIAGSAAPSPTAAGWNNTDVTVSFACAGSGTITCAAPVVVSQDGESDVSGQASSDAGGTATTSVHVKLDKTAPFLWITSPIRGQLVQAGPIVVSGTVIDALSGTVAVTCNGVAATFTQPTFSCTPTVPAGTSTIMVGAMDAASNVRTTTIDVSSTDVVVTSPPTSLRVTPQQVTMVSGQTRRFSLMDNLSRVPADAIWTIDNAAVATLSTAPFVTLTGGMAGTVTLAATWQGLTAATQVTVLDAGVQVPIGTTFWPRRSRRLRWGKPRRRRPVRWGELCKALSHWTAGAGSTPLKTG
jgi:hypothetical protein